MALDFQYLEIDGVEFDTYWQNGGYKKISDIIFAECHIFIVSNLCPGSTYFKSFLYSGFILFLSFATFWYSFLSTLPSGITFDYIYIYIPPLVLL